MRKILYIIPLLFIAYFSEGQVVQGTNHAGSLNIKPQDLRWSPTDNTQNQFYILRSNWSTGQPGYALINLTDSINNLISVGSVTLAGDVSGLSSANSIGAGKVTYSKLSQGVKDSLFYKVNRNANITGATKTKITYDAKGLVTSGADATTADISDSSNKRYVTDAQLVVIGNTSGTNTGDDKTGITGILKGNGSVISAAVSGTDYEAPLTFSTGLTRSTNTITVNTSQNISTLSNLTSNGLIKTSGGTGALSIASAGTDYLSPTGSGTGLTGIPYALSGTTNQINLSASTGNITFSLPTDVTINGDLTLGHNKLKILSDITSNNPPMLEFRRVYGGVELVRGSVGYLGSTEMNISNNMDYTDGTHKYYDSTKNAIWIYLGHTNGFGIQYVKANHPNDGNMFYNYGKVIYSVAPITNGSGEAVENGSWIKSQKLSLNDETTTSNQGLLRIINGAWSFETITAVGLGSLTASTSATVPLIYGGTSTTSTLQLRSTSGSGTTNSDIIFGDNDTEWARMFNNGNISIGSTTSISRLAIPIAPTASANIALLSLGDQGYAGGGSNFSGSSLGTYVGISATTGYGGNFIDFQKIGSSKFKVDNLGSITMSGSITVNSLGFIDGGGNIGNINRSYFKSNTDGNITWYNWAGSGFTLMQYGGTTASFPAHKRVATTIEARLANDSDYAATQSLYDRFGTGSPEGVVAAPVGAIFHRTDGGTGTALYVKETGTTTSSGWVAK